MKPSRKRKKIYFLVLPSGAIVALLVLLLLPLLTEAQGYVEPTAPAPTGFPTGRSQIEFLNGSTATQRKLGNLILGEKFATSTAITSDDARIAYYTCEFDDRFLYHLLVADPYLSVRTSFFVPTGSECHSATPAKYTEMMNANDNRKFDLIIAQESELHSSVQGRLESYVSAGGLLFVTGEAPNISAPDIVSFAGVRICQSYADDIVGSGCNFTIQRNTGVPETGGTVVNVDHGLFNFSNGDAFDKPPEQRFEGVMQVGGTVTPIIDVPYTMSRDMGNWKIGLAAHWQFGTGWVYYLADEARSTATATNGVCVSGSPTEDRTMCINGSFALTKTMVTSTFKKMTPGCVGDTCSAFCLNSDPTKGTKDPAACIRDWSDAVNLVGGPFLRLLPSTQQADSDEGFVTVRSDGEHEEYFSFIGEANDGGGNPVVNGSAGIRGRTSSMTRYAGKFVGRVVVEKETSNASICLNGAGNCVSSWSSIGGLPADSIEAHETRYLTKQDGHVATSGPIVSNTIVVGAPTSITTVNDSCGDGICSTKGSPGVNDETTGNCSADCL
jgi:hypothetical protein